MNDRWCFTYKLLNGISEAMREALVMQSFVQYFRVSTTGQAASGLGLEAQERDVQLYLDNYLDDEHEVIATFTEVDSGGKENRAELAKAIDVCKRNKATLIVSKVDRLSRDIHHRT